MENAQSHKSRLLFASNLPGLAVNLASLLSNDARFEVISVAADDCTLAAQIMLHRPEIVVYDFLNGYRHSIPALEGIDRLFGDRVRVIAYTDFSDWERIRIFFNSGGWGVVLKSCPDEEIIEAIRSVVQGIPFICPHLAGKWLRNESSVSPNIKTKLTSAELEVAKLAEEGLWAKEIATQRNVSVRTIEKQIEKIKNKLGIHHIRELRKRPLLTKEE